MRQHSRMKQELGSKFRWEGMRGKKQRMTVVAVTRIQGQGRGGPLISQALDSCGLGGWPILGREMRLLQQSRGTGVHFIWWGGSMCEMDSGVWLSRQEDKGRVILLERRGSLNLPSQCCFHSFFF